MRKKAWMLTVSLIALFSLFACNSSPAPVVEATVMPSTVTPASLITHTPTETKTPFSPTPAVVQDTITPTPEPTKDQAVFDVELEAQKWEQGAETVCLVCLEDTLKIDEENARVFRDQTVSAFWHVNRVELSKLIDDNGNALDTEQKFVEYTRTHVIELPGKIRVYMPVADSPRAPYYVDMKKMPIEGDLDLRKVGVEVLSKDEKEERVKQQQLDLKYSFSPIDQNSDGSIETEIMGSRIGINLRNREQVGRKAKYTLVVFAAHLNDDPNIGFPGEGKTISDLQITTMNDYLRFVVGLMRSLDLNSATGFWKYYHRENHNWSTAWTSTSGVDGIAKHMSWTGHLRAIFVQYTKTAEGKVDPNVPPSIVIRK